MPSIPDSTDQNSDPSAHLLNAFSIDVEDYFQVAAFEDVVRREDWERCEQRVVPNTLRLLDLLARHKVLATFFVLGWIAERWPDLVRRIRSAGHELACHGYDHRRVTALSPDEFRRDVRKSKDILEQIGGHEILGYRAPTYSIVRSNLWALDVLLEEGFRYDSSIFPIRHDRYGISDARRFPWRARESEDGVLHEFPISTVRLAGVNLPFVGGGYLRLFPMAFVRWGLRRLNGVERQPVMVYVHPWEIDPDQPRQPVGRFTRWRHYRNLDKTEERLDSLLREFRFAPVRSVLGL